MLHVDPKMPATVLTLSPVHGNKTVTTHVRGTSLKNAVRFVMERLPNAERSRSLIRTATHSLYFAEIEALNRQPEFLGENTGPTSAPMRPVGGREDMGVGKLGTPGRSTKPRFELGCEIGIHGGPMKATTVNCMNLLANS